MKIFIDIHEETVSPTIINYYNSHKEKYPHISSIITKHLTVSDLCTSNGLVGVERKSSSDLISSLFDGRLQQQLHELKQNFTYPHLIITDYTSINDLMYKNPQLHPNVIIGSLTSVISHSQVPYNFVGPFYTLFTLSLLEKYLDNKHIIRQKEYTPIRRTSTPNEEKIQIITGIKGIGLRDGTRILEHFNYSIGNIIKSSTAELEQIPNIGKEKAHKIKEILK